MEPKLLKWKFVYLKSRVWLSGMGSIIFSYKLYVAFKLEKRMPVKVSNEYENEGWSIEKNWGIAIHASRKVRYLRQQQHIIPLPN